MSASEHHEHRAFLEQNPEIVTLLARAQKRNGGTTVKLQTKPQPAAATKSETTDVAEFETTDVGNAARFVAQFGCDFRWSSARGAWLTWDGRRWAPDERLRVERCAKAIAKAIFDEARDATGKRQERLAKWAITSQRRERILATTYLARCELAARPSDFDSDSWAFNLANGTLDLRTGQLRPHRREDLLTKISPVEFDPAAKAPRFDAFMREIFADDESLIRYLQKFLGHCLTGDISEQTMPVWYGVGANGKSTLEDAVRYAMGDYADVAPPDLLLQRHNDEHPAELADLMGKRLVIASEAEKSRRLRVQLMKRLTGDRTLKARFMRENYFAFERTFKVVLITNNRPRVDEDSEAVWRRLRLIPFNVVIPLERRDANLGDKLKQEAAGILNWLLAGCLAWQRERLGEPPAVAQATAVYRESCDPLADFLKDCCVLVPAAWVDSDRLRAEYGRWANEQGEQPVSGRDFSDLLRRRGCTPQRRHSGRGWLGIGLLSPDSGTECNAGVTPLEKPVTEDKGVAEP